MKEVHCAGLIERAGRVFIVGVGLGRQVEGAVGIAAGHPEGTGEQSGGLAALGCDVSAGLALPPEVTSLRYVGVDVVNVQVGSNGSRLAGLGKAGAGQQVQQFPSSVNST